MAKAASKASSLTTLRIGQVEVPVALFSTVAKPGSTPQGFSTAGPNGGVLKARPVARAVPDDAPREELAPAHADPLAVGPDPAYFEDTPQAWAVAQETAHQALNAARVADSDSGASPGLVEELVEPAQPMNPLGPGPGMERDTFSEPTLSIGKMGPTVDLRTGEHLSDDDPRARAMGEFAEAVTASAVAEPSVPGEYGRELYEEGSGVVVAPEDVRRGVRLDDGRFIDCTTQLAEIEERTRLECADVVAFIQATAIPRVQVKASHYLGTDDPKAPRALAIIYEGLRVTRRAAVVKLTKRSRQTLGVIIPFRETLVLLEVVWAEDFRPPPPRALRHRSVQVMEREVAMFCRLVESMSEPPGVIDELRDEAIALREQLHAAALEGDVPEVLTPARPLEQNEIMEQLEASIGGFA